MKKLQILILALFLGACAASTSKNTIEPNTLNLSSNLSKSLVKSFKTRTNSNGFLEVELILKSTFSKDVVYKISWLDESGFVIRDVLNEDYEVLRLPGGQEVVLRKLAYDKKAKDFRIELKEKN